MIIVDVNVLVYAHNNADERSEKSAKWLDSTIASGESLGIPWHCVLGFLRIMTAPSGARRPLRLADAGAVVDDWFKNPQTVVPTPGPRFWKILQEVGDDSGTRGRDWSDAYLAALAIENGARFATFDRDFRKFKGLKLVEL